MSETMENLRREYEELFPIYRKLALFLKENLEDLLRSRGVSLAFPIQFRVKEWSSIEEKIGRKGKPISRVEDMTDLLGLRVITLYQSELKKICDCIEVLEIVEKDDAFNRLGFDEFGYRSIHYIARPPESWLKSPTTQGFRDKRVEIQARTATQHLWAAISHELQYKNKDLLGDKFKRDMGRLSAALESVDEEFERLLREIRTNPHEPSGTMDLLDLASLKRTLSDKLPGDNRQPEEDYKSLLPELREFRIDTVSSLTQFLHDSAGHIERAATFRKTSLNEFDLKVYDHVGLVRFAMTVKFGKIYTDFVKNKKGHPD